MSTPMPVRLTSLTAGLYVVLSAGALQAAQMRDIDLNGDGVITEAEFADFFRRGNYRVPDQLAKAAIEKYDLDGSGVVSAAEIVATGKANQQNASGNSATAGASNGETAQTGGNGQSNGNGQGSGGGNSSGNNGGGNSGGGNSGGSGNGGGSGNSGKK